jgi:hypothetical protein
VSKSERFHREDLIPCPSCGAMAADEYEAFRRAAWLRHQPPVTICELDLTPAEFIEFKRLRGEHPKASRQTVLMWLEGRRYRPEEATTSDPRGSHRVEPDRASGRVLGRHSAIDTLPIVAPDASYADTYQDVFPVENLNTSAHSLLTPSPATTSEDPSDPEIIRAIDSIDRKAGETYARTPAPGSDEGAQGSEGEDPAPDEGEGGPW